jgi:F0F1-type ATP synthase assembly protein I
MPPKSDRSLMWLGKYLSLALTLPASVVAGYILGAVLDHWLHWPILRAVGILLGMAAGLMQILRELSRDERRRAARR